MDEPTFQSQLHTLKQKVMEMSQNHVASSSVDRTPLPAPIDLFSHQLKDLRAHLDSLQHKIEDVLLKQASPVWRSPQSQISATAPPVSHSAFAGPFSEPLATQFAGYFLGHFDALGSRVENLQATVLELEDKVDRLDPNRFTPAGSTSTYDEHASEPSPNSHTRVNSSAPSQPKCQRQAFHDVSITDSPNDAIRQYQKSLMDFNGGHHNRQAAVALNWHLPNADMPVRREVGPHELAARPNTEQRNFEGVAYRDRELARMDELLRNAQEGMSTSEQQIAGMENRVEELQQEIRYLATRNDVLSLKLKRIAGELSNVQLELSHRDDQNEMLQNELLSKIGTIQSIQSANGELREECEHIRAINQQSANELEHAHAQIGNLQQLLQDCQNSKDDEIDQVRAGRDEETRKLQEFCEQKDAVASEQDRVIARGAELLNERDGEIEALRRELRALEDDKEHELRQSSRLSRLLSEQDSELEELRRMRQNVRYYIDKPRIATKFVRTEELDEMEALKKCISEQVGWPEPPEQTNAQEVVVRPWTGEVMPWTRERHIAFEHRPDPRSGDMVTSSPFVRPWTHKDNTSTFEPWTPQSIRGYSRLPHEARRAHVWVDGTSKPVQPVFGRPSPLGSPSYGGMPKPSAEGGDTGASCLPTEKDLSPPIRSVAERRPTPGPVPTSASVSENAERADSPRPRNRHRLPLDRTFWPPLPAPVAPHKVSSVADLQSPPRADRKIRLVKHQSMQELPRRSLQAYVETEGSGGELGGEV